MVIKFRVYISSIFFILIAVLLGVSFFFMRMTLQDQFRQEIIDRLRATVISAAAGVDVDDLAVLMDKLDRPVLSADDVDEVEKTASYRKVSNYLNQVRGSDPELFLFAYILAPTEKPEVSRFVVDADVLALKSRQERGKDLDQTISHFGLDYDISGQPETMESLREHKAIVTGRFVEDPDYHTKSMMGIAPIIDTQTGRFLGALGIDISSVKYDRFMNNVLFWSFLPMVLVGLLVVLFSIWVSHFISKPIVELTKFVKEFGVDDFKSRSRLESFVREVSDLNDGFNTMATVIEVKTNALTEQNLSMLRFVPTEFLTFLHRTEIQQVNLGDQLLKTMTIMFSDIRSFTAMSEGMTPQQVIDFLNLYFGLVGPVIRDCNGFVDKYLGDGILSVFPGSPDDAVHAALAMEKEVRNLNTQRAEQGLAPIEIGSAIHMGDVMIGTVGEEKRIQTTVISDAVNTASRLEAMNPTLQTRLLVSRTVFENLVDQEGLQARDLGDLPIRGRKDALGVVEIFNADAPEAAAKKLQLRPRLETVHGLVRAENWAEARKTLLELANQAPDDGIYEFWGRLVFNKMTNAGGNKHA